ncbi:MAG TPA: hypothetical protein PK566_16410 [Pseudobacteroides sp.]|nr:hypothetical protein [Pseudobacteroides sp.]
MSYTHIVLAVQLRLIVDIFITGPAIYVNGGHYHYYRGNTSAAIIPNRHIHLLGGYTSIYRG